MSSLKRSPRVIWVVEQSVGIRGWWHLERVSSRREAREFAAWARQRLGVRTRVVAYRRQP